jgi:hypothetical protein
VLIAKTNMNEEINSCIIDRKLYVKKVEFKEDILKYFVTCHFVLRYMDSEENI